MKPLALIILDGWGERTELEGNAVRSARTPNFDTYWEQSPHTFLNTTGEHVGLPAGVMGNSEVGHLNLGAGRVVYQALSRINNSIADASLVDAPAWRCVQQRAEGRTLHLMGLLSDGGVHSHIDHIEALVTAAAAEAPGPIRLHVFTDGRDTSPHGGAAYLQRLETFCTQFADVRIATVCGRYFAMDRDSRWERTERAYRVLTVGEGERPTDLQTAVRASYEEGVTDEFLEPLCMDPEGLIQAEDTVVFVNFRGDRARQIVQALADPDFPHFARPWVLPAQQLVCMTQYHESYQFPVLFPPQRMADKFGDVLAAHGKTQLRVAETEKYAHVTFFFNGGEDAVSVGESHALVPSRNDVATYDECPEMSAAEVADAVCARIADDCPDVIICNFANPDMVGHTGNIPAAVKAVEAVDACLGRVLGAIRAVGGAALVTADHGNAEEMLTPAGKPHTAHTTNLVPCMLVGDSTVTALRDGGKLADVAPTLLALLALQQPVAMTGESLLCR